MPLQIYHGARSIPSLPPRINRFDPEIVRLPTGTLPDATILRDTAWKRYEWLPEVVFDVLRL